jgi:hypothetical protein
MLRIRVLVMMGVCFLAASGAWADDVGYVDCSKNADATQVFGKPRKTPDVVATLPCGERFAILVYGFYFSRIQTRDGQIGYIYSSLIVQDRGVTSLQQVASAQPAVQPKAQTTGQQAGQQTPSLQVAAEKTKIPRSTPFDAQPTAAPAQPESSQPATQPAAVAPSSTQAGAGAAGASTSTAADTSTGSASSAGTAAASSQPAANAVVQPQPATAQPAVDQPSAQPAVTTAPVLTTPPTSPATPNADATETASNAAQPPAADAQPAAAQPVPEPEPPAATPEPAPAPAQPAPIQPAPSIRPVDTRDRWEKPQPSGRQAPLLELFGGFSFARLGGAGTSSNLVGGLGSIGWNANSWLQVSADTSYNLVTNGNTQSVLYGNHYGPRFYYRRRNRWNITPFGEALIGGSDIKTTVSGTGGSVTSTGSQISYKVGGGLDMRPTRRWEIRLLDVDYYRTAFGTNGHQTNYWISTGVVLRLFGGGNE